MFLKDQKFMYGLVTYKDVNAFQAALHSSIRTWSDSDQLWRHYVELGGFSWT